RLGDVDIGTQHGDGGGRAVVALVGHVFIGGGHGGRVAERAAVGCGGHAADVDDRRRPRGQGADEVGQDTVRDRGALRARGTRESSRQRVADRYVVGGPRAGVADGDGEGGRVSVTDGAGVGGLDHGHVGALHGDGGGRGVVARVVGLLVGRGHRGRVGE